MQQALKHSVKGEASPGKARLEFDRVDVLSLLWKRACWLDEKVELKQLKINPALKQRVYMCQVEASLCKTLLYGLKSEETEARLEKLEELLKDSVVIPNE